ncbi:hypothetical protein ACLOJK_000781 [Asimina triloba]
MSSTSPSLLSTCLIQFPPLLLLIVSDCVVIATDCVASIIDYASPIIDDIAKDCANATTNYATLVADNAVVDYATPAAYNTTVNGSLYTTGAPSYGAPSLPFEAPNDDNHGCRLRGTVRQRLLHLLRRRPSVVTPISDRYPCRSDPEHRQGPIFSSIPNGADCHSDGSNGNPKPFYFGHHPTIDGRSEQSGRCHDFRRRFRRQLSFSGHPRRWRKGGGRAPDARQMAGLAGRKQATTGCRRAHWSRVRAELATRAGGTGGHGRARDGPAASQPASDRPLSPSPSSCITSHGQQRVGGNGRQVTEAIPHESRLTFSAPDTACTSPLQAAEPINAIAVITC